MMDLIVDWLATYALHSTVFLCAVYLLERLRVLVEIDVRENGWRIAALAPIFTAAMQVALTVSGTMAPESPARNPVALASPSPMITSMTVSGPKPTERAAQRSTSPASKLALDERINRPTTIDSDGAFQIPLPIPKQWIAIVWLVGGMTAVGLLGFQFFSLRRKVGAFRTCCDRNVVAEVLELAQRAGVRIDAVKQFDSASTALVIPPATLCMPTWAVSELHTARRRAMIAHEVAHVARRDPWWRLIHRAVARILFFQPMNWVALKKLDQIAELSCDEWAANAADRRALMECLVECGERIVARQPALVATMARHRSTLIERIGALCKQAPRQPLRVYAARLTLLALCLGVLSLPMLGFEETSGAAFAATGNSGSSWSMGDVEGQGVRVKRKSGFAGLGPRLTMMKVELANSTLGARIEGDVKFSAAEDSVTAIDGSLVIEEQQGATLSRIEVDAGKAGEVLHRFQVDHQSRTFEPEGRQFMARTVPIVLRESLIDADGRIRRLLARGAGNALDEVAQIRGGFSRRVYLAKLVGLAQLDSTQVTRAIDLAATIKSDFERRVAMNALLDTQPIATAHGIAVLSTAANMKSDFEQRTMLTKLIEKWDLRDASGPAIEAWSKALASVDSDFEARLVIVALAREDSLDPALIEVLLRSIDTIDSDFEARLALAALAPHLSKTPALAVAYAKATHTIASDFEKRVALARLIDAVELDVSSFKAVLHAAEAIESNFECRQVLRALLARLPADQEAIELYRRSSNRCHAA